MTNESDKQPRFVICPCQHCSGKIEFDANHLDPTGSAGGVVTGQTVPCPHCGLETILYVPPSPTPSIIPVPKRKSGGRKWILLALAVAIIATIVFWCLGAIQEIFGFVIGCIVFLLILAVGLAIYFLPTIIAISAKKTNTLAIFLLNFFLGWTLIGWVVALVWSAMKDDKI